MDMKRGQIIIRGTVLLVLLGALTHQVNAQSIPSIPGGGSLPSIPGGGSLPSIPGGGSLPSIPGGGSGLSGVGSGLSGAGSGLSGVGGAAAADPALSGVAAAPAAAAAAPAQPATLWSFLGLSKSNLSACKTKFCGSQLGTLVNSGMTGPLSAITGGLIGGCCPTTPNAAQLAAAGAAGGPQGLAAQIQAEEAQAKAKIAAIEYLATVDCKRWPEAEKVLVDRLRSDRNECVRYAAARALGTGCCCTKKTIAGLKLVVECSDADGNPMEGSERVKSAAWYALNHCVTRYVPPKPAPRERPSEPTRPEFPTAYQPGSRLPSYEETLENTPDELLIEEARKVLIAARGAPLGNQTLPTGSRSLFNAVYKAAAPPQPQAQVQGLQDPALRNPAAAPERSQPPIVLRTTAPPFSAPPPPVITPPSTDRTIRPASFAPIEPIAGVRRPPRSLFDVFTASRKPQPGA